MTSRRPSLDQFDWEQATNAGLWLDKFLASGGQEDKECRHNLVQEVKQIKPPRFYATFFERWQSSLRQLGARMQVARVTGRMAVGLGASNVLENSIALHPTTGMPFIPGSSLKGTAASFAKKRLGVDWQESGPAFQAVFGTQQVAGYVTFFDALSLPTSNASLVPDVITVHHPEYYQGKSAPADWDDPNPIPLLSATGPYLLALRAPTGCDDWVSAALEILRLALSEAGVGAKTSSGYGRLIFEPKSMVENSPVSDLLRRLDVVPPPKLLSEVGGFVDELGRIEASPAQKAQLAQAVVEKLRAAGLEKKTLKRPWRITLVEYLDPDAET